ncbi:hypothetical protein ACQ4PT_030621 [Festuca glaucescens]
MVDPLSLVGLIIEVVKQIASAAARASQNKHKCSELAQRANNLAAVLPSLAECANDMATARVLERLKDALGDALRLIQSCRRGGLFSCYCFSRKATKLDNVDRCINNCILDLNLNSHSSHHQAQGGASSAFNVQLVPYAAAPAPSGSDHSSLYTLPTLNKAFKRVYDAFH